MPHRVLQFCFVSLALFLGSLSQESPRASQKDESRPLQVQVDHYPPRRVSLADKHRLTDIQILRVPQHVFDDMFRNDTRTWVIVKVLVDAKGNVVSAIGHDDHVKLHPAAIEQAKTWKYKPFLRDDKPVSATFDEVIDVLPQERLPRHHVPFPSINDWNSLRISLEREDRYRVEIFGDGTVVYEGKPSGTVFDVVVGGEHREHISPELVSQLVERFRKADFFSLPCQYGASKCRKNGPDDVISIAFDGVSKSVVDAYGELFGMPQAVTDLEDAVDQTGDTEKWVSGNEKTVPTLKREGYDFKSPAANKFLYHTLTLKLHSPEVVRDLLAAGVPTEKPREYEGCVYAWTRGNPELMKIALAADLDRGVGTCRADDLTVAALTGDLQFVRTLIRRGFDPRAAGEIGSALTGAAESGSVAMVAEILKYHPDPNSVDWSGKTALFLAAEHYGGETDDEQRKDTAARVQIIHMLLKAGTDPRIRERTTGNTPLHDAHSAEAARALIEAGTDVNARNKEGQTPLMLNRSPEVTRVLIAAGADLSIKVKDGRTVLEELLYLRKKFKGNITDAAKEQIAMLQAAQNGTLTK